MRDTTDANQEMDLSYGDGDYQFDDIALQITFQNETGDFNYSPS